MRFVFTALFLFLYCSAIFSQNVNPDSSAVKKQWGIFYTENEDSLQSLDVYWNSKSKNAKVLIFVHGGGWLSGDKKSYREMAAQLSDNGITVLLVNYRLSPAVKFPAHVEDVTAAVYWTYLFINKYNGDKDNIYLMGHSAGGHLISLILCDKSYLGKYGMVPTDIAGAVTISAVFEIKTQDGGASKKFLGMVFSDNEMVWRNASCKNHIDSTSKNSIAHFLISWGEKEDPLIVNESKNIIAEFKKAGIDFQTYIFEENKHNAFNNDLKNNKSAFYKRLMQFIDQR
jgi:acetyl esterase/lipase